MNTEDLFARVVRACPPFEAQVEEHVADYGEVLGHVLMGDLSRLIEGYFTRTTNLTIESPTEGEMRAVLALLDEGLADSDEDVENVIAVSSVEGLWLQPYWPQLSTMLGPDLTAEAARMESWRPPT
jgi:hypothetical protein